MKYILIILSLALLSSCSVEQMANYHCKRCPTKDSTYINIVDSIVPRDSVVLIPRDSFKINFKDSVPCYDFEANGNDSKGNSAKLIVKKGKASVICDCADYKLKISWLEKHSKMTFKQTKTRTVYENKKTRFRIFKDYWFWVSVSLLAFIIVRFFLKLAKKWPFPF